MNAMPKMHGRRSTASYSETMTGTRHLRVTALLIAVLVIAIPSRGRDAATQASTALPVDVTWILSDAAQFPADQLAVVRRGEVIAKTETMSNDFAASAVAAVRIATPKQRAVDYFHQLTAYEDGQVTLQFGT